MIITKLKGGLGNQMFQYAHGKALAVKNNTSLLLDISFYNDQTSIDSPRPYDLKHFAIEETIAQKDILPSAKLSFFSRIIRKIKITLDPQAFSKEYDRIIKINDDTYLDGYWQSENYFKDIGPIIRKQYVLKDGFSTKSEGAAMIIKNFNNSVAVHIRRGDYIKVQSNFKFFNHCDQAYYDRAIDIIKNKIGPDLDLCIFSDDIEWVKNNMKFQANTHYISEPGIPPYEELVLMSKCKHTIIANSTFSWWSAWLNANPNKIVIAPKQWFADPAMKEANDSIVPSTWIRT